MEYKKILFLLFVIALSLEGFSQVKQTVDKIAIQPQRRDSIKDLHIKTEPALIDTLTNLKGKFKPYKKAAHASYYHDKFTGRRTASGQKFDNQKYTAAHRKLPFGTKLKVTNEKNGKSVIVEITDRGPFTKGREIDLTKKAFMEIADNKKSGIMVVTIDEAVKK